MRTVDPDTLEIKEVLPDTISNKFIYIIEEDSVYDDTSEKKFLAFNNYLSAKTKYEQMVRDARDNILEYLESEDDLCEDKKPGLLGWQVNDDEEYSESCDLYEDCGNYYDLHDYIILGKRLIRS